MKEVNAGTALRFMLPGGGWRYELPPSPKYRPISELALQVQGAGGVWREQLLCAADVDGKLAGLTALEEERQHKRFEFNVPGKVVQAFKIGAGVVRAGIHLVSGACVTRRVAALQGVAAERSSPAAPCLFALRMLPRALDCCSPPPPHARTHPVCLHHQDPELKRATIIAATGREAAEAAAARIGPGAFESCAAYLASLDGVSDTRAAPASAPAPARPAPVPAPAPAQVPLPQRPPLPYKGMTTDEIIAFNERQVAFLTELTQPVVRD